MGTIVYVPNEDLPEGTTLIPTKFAYKCKFGDHGQMIKKKGRLVVRGDLQKEHEYTDLRSDVALQYLESVDVSRCPTATE
eukprot:8351-Rhodomonas_salina.1